MHTGKVDCEAWARTDHPGICMLSGLAPLQNPPTITSVGTLMTIHKFLRRGLAARFSQLGHI